MKRRLHQFSAVALCLILSACQSQTPGAAPTSPAAPVAATGQTPAAPAAEVPQVPSPSALQLPGMVEGPDGPFTNAQVSVYAVGNNTAIATGTTGADGTFQIGLPAEASGKLLKIVAVRDKATLVATTMLGLEEPKPNQPLRLLQAQPGVSINLGSTLLALTLLPRLTALMATNPSPRTMLQTMRAIVAAAKEAIDEIKKMKPDDVTILLAVASPLGEGTVPDAIAKVVTANPAFRNSFQAAADLVGDAIRQQVDAGATLPPGYDYDSLTFGSVTSGSPTQGSGGGSSGGGASGTTGVGATVAIGVTGSFIPSQDATGVSTTHLPGAVLGKSNLISTFSRSAPAADGSTWIVGGAHLQRLTSDGLALIFSTSSDNGLACVISDGADGAWVAEWATPQNHRLKHVTAAGTVDVDVPIPDNVETMVLNSDGSLWLGYPYTSDGIITQSGGVRKYKADGTLLKDIPMLGLWSMVSNGADGVWAYQPSSWYNNYATALLHQFDADGEPVALTDVTIKQSDHGILMADGKGGVYLEEGYDLRHITTTSSRLLDGAFNFPEMMVDADGHMWASPAGKPVRYAPDGTKTELPLTSISGTRFQLDGQGGFWLTSYDGKLIHCDGQGAVLTQTPIGSIDHVMLTSDGVWAVYDSRLKIARVQR